MSEADQLARNWRDARLPSEGLHLDSAACSRQSVFAIEAADYHARLESEVGGYVAADAAGTILRSGRVAVATLTGMVAEDVVFTTGSGAALGMFLKAWAGQRTVACLPGEYGPNLAAFADHGFNCLALPVDSMGRADPEATTTMLRTARPAIVHLTALGSHRGVAQPVTELATVCRMEGVPLVVDAAQALGHIDCAVGADVVYASSRKWLAGPRGVGILSIRPHVAESLRVPNWAMEMQPLAWLEHGEANLAARVGFSVAVNEHISLGAASIRQCLALLGEVTRRTLSELPGWRVIEPIGEPTAITTLEPTSEGDPAAVRAHLLADHGILITAVGTERAPGEMTRPVLRISPHIDSTLDDIETLAAALAGYSSGFST